MHASSILPMKANNSTKTFHNVVSFVSHNSTSFSMIHICVAFLVVSSSLGPVLPLPLIHDSGHRVLANRTFNPEKNIQKLRRVEAYLKKINKPGVRTIQSPDGDVIDCVPSHLQPAFDHPELRGQKPLDPPARPKGHNYSTEAVSESFQLWTDSGESCPEGTVPIRRTTEKDIQRASSVRRYGRRTRRRYVRRDSTGSDHEHAVVFENGDQYYGAKASLNVWAPPVMKAYEFSLSQIWIISGSFGNDLNTIEAGWQVSPELYGDNYPRFFTYWTSDAYQTTGCYNLLCSGFVQINNKIAIGAAISPWSSYEGRQFDINLMVWKDPKHGHWWLQFGSGLLVGYWPVILFSHLRSHANMVQFGGEIVNTRSSGFHTSTQMGSGHFPQEGFGKAAYFRNLQTVDWDNNLVPLRNIQLSADSSNCYDIRQGRNNVWGTYFYYGGPGRNALSLAQMESETDQSSKTKMGSLRTICDTQLSIQHHKLDSFTASFPSSLNSINALAFDTAQNHAKLAQIKANLREAEDQLLKVLAAKSHKEAKQMSTRDSISAIKARVELLKTTVQLQRTRRDEYGAIISSQSLALSKTEEDTEHELEENGEIQEAISWYNGVLGFQIQGGHGVKFTFNDINIKNPKQEYSFTIRHANDAYSLLDCNPHLNGITELINELNRTYDLFGFVRIMREKFQEAAALGLQPQSTSFHQDCSTISMPGPAFSVSTNISEYSAKKNEQYHIPLQDVNGKFKKVIHGSKSPAKINKNQINDGAFSKHPKEVAKSDILSLVHQSTQLKEVAKSDILSPIVHRSPRLKKVAKQNLLSPVVRQSHRLKV